MPPPPWSGARWLERMIYFKYYIVQKWESRFTFGQNATKNTSNKSCRALNFVQKIQWVHVSIFPRSGAMEHERLIRFKYYIILK